MTHQCDIASTRSVVKVSAHLERLQRAPSVFIQRISSGFCYAVSEKSHSVLFAARCLHSPLPDEPRLGEVARPPQSFESN